MFYLHRYPEVGYETAEKALLAVEELDARTGSEPCVTLRVEGEEEKILSYRDLKEIVVENEIARETSEPSVRPTPVTEGEEEAFGDEE